jgi:hypothetical protein
VDASAPHAGLALHVAGVLGEVNREAASGALLVTAFQLLQRLMLRIHERRDAVPWRRLPQERVNDRQKIRQAFARAGAAGDDVGFPPAGEFQGLDLVLVEVERLAMLNEARGTAAFIQLQDLKG